MIVSPPPQNQVAECIVLGTALVDSQRAMRDCGNLGPADFYNEKHAQIWQAIQSLHNRGEHIDPISVAETMGKAGTLEKYDDVPLIANLMESADPFIVKRESDKIVEARERRELLYLARQIESGVHDPSQSLTDLRAIAFDGSRGSEPGKERFPSWTARELDDADFNLEYLIPGILVKGQPGLYVGPQKSLKTNTAIDLVLSLSSGFPFLGEFKVKQTVTAAFVSGESGESTIQETARRIALSKGQPLRAFENVHFVFNLPSLTSDEDLHHLRRFVENKGIEFLFLDPCYLMLDGIGDRAGNLFEVGPILRKLSEAMHELEATPFLCHHTKNRARQYDPAELQDIAWAGFQEFARQWVLLSRRSQYDPDSGGFHDLWLNAGGSAGHSNLWGVNIMEGRRTDDGGRRWEVSILTATEARAEIIDEEQEAQNAKKERQEHDDREKVLKALQRFPEGETETQIGKAAKLSNKRTGTALYGLEDLGQAEQIELQKSNNQKYPGWKLTTRTHRDSPGKHPDNPSVTQHRTHPDSPPIGGVGVCECEGECVCGNQSEQNPSGRLKFPLEASANVPH